MTPHLGASCNSRATFPFSPRWPFCILISGPSGSALQPLGAPIPLPLDLRPWLSHPPRVPGRPSGPSSVPPPTVKVLGAELHPPPWRLPFCPAHCSSGSPRAQRQGANRPLEGSTRLLSQPATRRRTWRGGSHGLQVWGSDNTGHSHSRPA